MKRLLCIVGVMDMGGAETFLMKLYRELDRNKYQMDFCVSTGLTGCYEEEISLMGGRIFKIPKGCENDESSPAGKTQRQRGHAQPLRQSRCYFSDFVCCRYDFFLIFARNNSFKLQVTTCRFVSERIAFELVTCNL